MWSVSLLQTPALQQSAELQVQATSTASVLPQQTTGAACQCPQLVPCQQWLRLLESLSVLLLASPPLLKQTPPCAPFQCQKLLWRVTPSLVPVEVTVASRTGASCTLGFWKQALLELTQVATQPKQGAGAVHAPLQMTQGLCWA